MEKPDRQAYEAVQRRQTYRRTQIDAKRATETQEALDVEILLEIVAVQEKKIARLEKGRR